MGTLREPDRLERPGGKMVSEQIAARGVSDPRVLAAMGKVPRHFFVPEAMKGSAYGDFPLPIGQGQTISQPYIVASMTEALRLTGKETVLEIGTGSGYQTAILAELARRVYSVERVAALAGTARKTLEQLGYHNILIRVGDGSLGWAEYAPFDRILVTAGSPSLPAPLLEQLGPGGIMVLPVGGSLSQVLTRVTRREDGSLLEEQLLGCVFVKLIGQHGWQQEV